MCLSFHDTGLQHVSLRGTGFVGRTPSDATVASFVRALVLPLLWIALCLGSAAATPGAQGTDEGFSVRLADPVLKLGDSTQLIVDVRDRQPNLLRLPDVEGVVFGQIQGPSLYRSVSFSGGRTVRDVIYTYTVPVSCDTEGRYDIPPIVGVFGSDELASEPLLLEVVRDQRGEALGFLQIDLPFERVAVGQSFPVEIEFGVRASATSRTSATFDLTLPWLGSLGREAVEVLAPDRRDGAPTEATISGTMRVPTSAARSRVVDGETYRIMRLRLLVTPLRIGNVDLSGTVLRIRTGRWRESTFLGREFQPTDEFFKRLGERSFEVRPLPEEGRPLGFTGAVGDFDARASLDVSEMFVGDSFKLIVDYTGSGNLSDFAAPNLELSSAFADRFAVYGVSEERDNDRRRVVFDLAPLSAEVDEVPPVELWTFDPLTWTYRVVATDPQPVRVLARATAAPPVVSDSLTDEPAIESFERDIVDIETGPLRAAGPEGSAPRESTLLALLGAVAVAWIALRLAARRESGPLGSAADRRRALRRLERELGRAETPEQDLRAWTGFLAARTGVPAEAWVGRDVRRLARRSSEDDLGEVTTDLIARTSEHLEAAAYGDDPRVTRDQLVTTARDLLEEGL
ncbi:hypothetical protein Pla163_25930 [Planctomycetes bacterium Pla163]|uniref:Protein BatD n=1 Tax=Rohdeia mirabilis TaxID=2528008 RepID=A0A518D1W2_9BACT|nr:hypothetical protein Pla163_25930 [Planctomycetes bacterium Pla163]